VVDQNGSDWEGGAKGTNVGGQKTREGEKAEERDYGASKRMAEK